FFQLGNRDSGGTQDVEMIAAEDGGVYKEAPQTPGGMKVDGEGDTAYAASEGADPDGRIDLDAIPEAPVAGAQGVAPAEQMKVKTDARTAQAEPKAEAPVVKPEPAPEPAAATPAVGGTSVQLGAFSSNSAAQGAWKSLSGRISALKPLNNSVVTATVGGKTVYRLRASVANRADANTLCGKLKVAGESCSIVN
ncbi:MAG TPA: SPOR domain-containing protein, partial [Sphingomonadaceae bacterium]|nr:SPOR domain-containing protein [Sphingomonadaceae bacterium]